jgi:hypothetical protein
MTPKRRKELQRMYVELEWRRCATDEAYFIEKYVWIPSEDDPRGRTRFEMFDYQHELMNLVKEQRFVIALKARQIGFTTMAMAHGLWLALFKPGATVLIISRTQESSNKNLAQARMAYQFLPPWMRERAPKLVSDSTKGMSFHFHDGMISDIKAASATSGVFAGETASLVIWDEAALVEPASLQEDVLRTLLPCTDAGGSMMVISTARGAYNRFAKTYRTAKKGGSQFTTFFKPWFVSPFMKCSKACGWCGGQAGLKTPCVTKYDQKRREFSDEPWKMFSEYPENEEEAFRESGRPRFVGLAPENSFEHLPFRGNLVWENDHTIAFEADPAGPLHIATLEPDHAGFYVVSADPAQGIGKDFSSAQVLTMDEDGRPEIVGYYHSNTVHPAEFASDLDLLGRFFKGREWAAKLGVENQGGQGELVINELHRHLEYPNPYIHQMAGQKRSRAVRQFAFPMTVDRRRAVIDRLAKYLLTRDDGTTLLGGIYPALRVELGQFVAQETANGNIRYAADVGCHDDLVMSLAIGLWILVEEYTESSPDAAPIEEAVWRPRTSINLNLMREDRRKLEAEQEELNRWMYESMVLGAELVQRPPRGR